MKLIKKYFLITVMALSLVLICGCTGNNKTTQLDKPANLVCDSDYILTWDSVENATGYTVLVGTKSFTVTTNSADLKDHLVEGKNNVWVTATSTDSKYTTSEGASIVVTYDPFTASTLVESLTEQYKAALESQKGDFKSEEEFNAHCANMASEVASQLSILCKDTNVTIKQVLALNNLSIVMSFNEGPEITDVFGAVNVLRESEITYRTLATISYNALVSFTNSSSSTTVEVDESSESNINAIVTIFATNKTLTVDTLEVVYEYLDKVLADVEVAYKEFDGSTSPEAMFTLISKVIKALLGENRPRVADFTTLVSFFQQYIAMYVATEKDNTAVQTLPDVFNFVVSIIDPVLDIVYKTSSALTTSDLATIMNSVMVIVDKIQSMVSSDNQTEITPEVIVENVQTIVENVQIIMATVSTAAANVDISNEVQAITTALNTLISSESVQNVIKEVAVMVIQMIKPDVTPEKAAEMYGKICEIIGNIDPETTTVQEVVKQILTALEMTEDEAKQLVMNTIASAVVSNVETPEEAEAMAQTIVAILEQIKGIEQEDGTIKLVDILNLIPAEYKDVVASLFPDADPETVIPANVVAFVKELLNTISEQAQAKVEELSDNIQSQYIGTWVVSTEETETPLFTSVEITAYSIYLDYARAGGVTYSGNDYYGYTLTINGVTYYVSLSGDRLLIASPNENKDTEYTKDEVIVDPSDDKIPAAYQGTFTGEKDGVTYTAVITETTITFNDSELTIVSYDDYEGFTCTYNDQTLYVMLGYADGEIMIVNEDYSFYVTLKIASDQPSTDDQLVPAEYVGTYTGTLDDITYTVVLEANKIIINDIEVTVVEKDGNDITVSYNDKEWYISLSYADGIFLQSGDYSVYGLLNPVK